MKKYIAVLMMFSIGAIAQKSKAQSIPNGDFKNWNKQSRTAPMQWRMLGNFLRDSSTTENYGVMLLNDTSSKSSSTMYLTGKNFPDLYTGGFSINGLPTSMKVTYRSDQLQNDTAIILVGFTKANDNNPVVLQQFYLLPNNGSLSNDAIATFPLTNSYPIPGAVPDSGFVVVSSSLRGGKPNSSGNITITDISFSNTQPLTTSGNINLNNWVTTSLEEPNNWTTYLKNYYFSRTEPANLNLTARSGSLLKLQSQIVNIGPVKLDTLAAWAMCSNLSDTPSIDKPGFAINKRPGAIKVSLNGMVLAADRFSVIVNLFDADTLVGTASYSATNINYNTNPTIIENISWFPGYSGTPTKANIGFWLTDSTFSTQSSINSLVNISKVEFLEFGLNTNIFKNKNSAIRLYPIPNQGDFTVEFNPNFHCSQITLVNSSGQVQYQYRLDNQSIENNKVQLKNKLAPGIYWFIAISERGESQRLPFIVN